MNVQQPTQVTPQPVSQPATQPMQQPLTQSVSVPMGMMPSASYAQPNNVAVNMNYGVVNNPTPQVPSQLKSLQFKHKCCFISRIDKDVRNLFCWWEYMPILFILDVR